MNATNLRRPRALLLDDDANVLRTLGAALEERGFDVLAATDAASGLELLLDELLDLDVLVAGDLPGRDAVSLVHLVRHAGGEQELGLVILGTGDRGLRDQLLALGADAVVDRALGVETTVEAIASAAAAASRRAYPATARPAAVHPAVRGALVVVRARARARGRARPDWRVSSPAARA